jgi:glycosyltransferase involved in cell wall biosynthesis
VTVKVLHVFGHMKRGGAEIRTVDVMKFSDRGQFRFDCLSLSGQAGELDGEVRALGGQVHLLMRGPLFPFRFRSLLRKWKYDVVHSHVLFFSGFILRWASQEGVGSRIAHFRGSANTRDVGFLKAQYHRLGKRLISKHATRILAVSNASMIANWGREFRNDPRCEVVYNGLEAPAQTSRPDRSAALSEFGFTDDLKIILHVGNVTPPKNHRRMMEIFRMSALSRPDLRLLMVGSGTEQLLQMTKDVCFGDARMISRIRACGQRNDAPRLMSVSDVVLHPSLSEGLPGVVLEAMSIGVPVVASDIPAIKEISSYFSGIVMESLENDDHAWKDALDRGLSFSGEQRRDMISEFLRSPFGIETCASRFQEIWMS